VIRQSLVAFIVRQFLRSRLVLVVVVLAFCFSVVSCNRKLINREYAYVSAPQVNVRDRLANVYNKVAVLKNGDKVEVIDRQKRFVKVRTEAGQEGWVEQRYLAGQDVYDAMVRLTEENAGTPGQGHAVTRAELNMRLEPGRDSKHLYQLKDGERIEVIRRAVAEKKNTHAVPVRTIPSASGGGKQQPPAEPPKLYEDWWLVRDSSKRTGWVLGRMIDIDIPLEVAQYAEGQRIHGAYILNEVQDGDKKVPQYLMLASEPKDGMPFDFNQIRIFTWNVKRHRYETAYRERNLFGVLPVTTGFEDFGTDGRLPYFVIRTRDASGNVLEKKYKLNGPIVRRVLAPGEQSAADAAPQRPQPRRAAPRRRNRR